MDTGENIYRLLRNSTCDFKSLSFVTICCIVIGNLYSNFESWLNHTYDNMWECFLKIGKA